jgi:GT2 family glycosyltransferase
MAIYSNTVIPAITIVGDDSTDITCIKQNQKIVSTFQNCLYLPGKCNGPSQNRKDLIDELLRVNDINSIGLSHLASIDDDIIITNRWFENAIQYLIKTNIQIPLDYHIIYGPYVENLALCEGAPQLYKFSFIGHFTLSNDNITYCVNMGAAIFPVSLFKSINFDQSIVFGYEDADLCNRAISLGYKIDYVATMPAIDNQCGKSSLAEGGLRAFDLKLKIDSARLYVTFKKYLCVDKSRLKAICFLIVFSLHLIGHRIKSKLTPFPYILSVYKKSKFWRTIA